MSNLFKSELFAVWLKSDKRVRNDKVVDYVKNKLGGENFTSKHKQIVLKFCTVLRQKWNLASRTSSVFQARNKTWLSGKVFPDSQSAKNMEPKKAFNKLSLRSKRRRVAELRHDRSASELSFAAQMNARSEGNEDAAKLLAEAMQSTPTRSTRIRSAWSAQNALQVKPARKLSEEEALCFYVDGNFSKSLWIKMRQNHKICNIPQIYPSYQTLMQAREKCIPSKEFISVSESTAEVGLQAVLDHTATQIMVLQDEVLLTLSDVELNDLELVSKWGMDGSDLPNYKQRFSNDQLDDSSMFVTSLVPIQLRVKSCPSKVIWHNLRSSSTRFCRPIRIQFAKETKALTIGEKENIDAQIAHLSKTTTQNSNSTEINISHTMVCSMVDGKVCSTLSELSCQRCFVCGAFPRELNDIEKILKKPINKTALKFGLSPLHCNIRCMECLLHIAYRLDVKCWQARTPHQKESVAKRKKGIQEAFKSQMGLIIDVPKHGSGTSNDGNTARRFFQNPSQTAAITGLNQELIEKFANILSVISSGFEIDADKFQQYCIATARQYVQEYGWYKMPPSVHRMLIHSGDIIKAAVVPIGTLSEEPQECRNKDIKNFRENRARKCSRVATNQDIFNRLMVSSDPLISSVRKIQSRKNIPFTRNVLQFLKESNIPRDEIIHSSSDEDSESDEL